MKNVGVIGCGFVGKAVAHGFALHANVKMYDKYNNNYQAKEEVVNGSDYLFVCVPTPMDDQGFQDLSCIKEALKAIDECAEESKTIIIKSTVIPGTTRNLAEMYPRHTFVFNPEFLTERTADLDFINPSRIILGCERGEFSNVDGVRELYRVRFSSHPIFETTWEGAEVVKYMSNCFFAAKISFLNEFYDVADHIGVDFEDLCDMWLADGRIGNSHVDVPGHDGSRGYGGKCFPKDVRALIRWAESNGLGADMCRAADQVNNKVRETKDWLDIKGATSSNSYDETVS